MKKSLWVLVALGAISAAASTDAPLEPPGKLTICSASHKYCATSGNSLDITVVGPTQSQAGTWSIPGGHCWLFVLDDGEPVVVGYEGMNLVPKDVQLDEPVLFFYRQGKRVRTIRLGELYQKISQLERAVSHLAWTEEVKFNRANQWGVEPVDGRKLAFAAKTGLPEQLAVD